MSDSTLDEIARDPRNGSGAPLAQRCHLFGRPADDVDGEPGDIDEGPADSGDGCVNVDVRLLALRREIAGAGDAARLAVSSTTGHVYTMRMARVNVYLPDDLADAARKADLNVSGITRAALTSALAEGDTNRWLDTIARIHPTKVTHAQALEALHAARDEMGTTADA
ncbi:MAG: type II toxin-antitoxin system CcdA family antitoxin [Actinomycetota bacterium]|nr:type II toxin-antitoxin system CcdA family antitoxin [Actinomycetota bacterium]